MSAPLRKTRCCFMVVALGLSLTALAGGCRPSRIEVADVTKPPEGDATLGVGDVVEIRVFGEADLTGTYRIGAKGTVNFPLTGPILLSGMDSATASREIEDKLRAGIMRNPQVTVLIREQASRKITILGQVVRPGTIAYTTGMTVIEALSMVGGFGVNANINGTTLTRTTDGKKVTESLPMGDITAGRTPNVYLRPGDLISVPERLF